jgi:SagB-type dehydrogenase family enzyme
VSGGTTANERIEVARAFHEATAHTPYSVHASAHILDWDVKPLPFKVYSELAAIALPRAFDPVFLDTLAALDPARPGAPAPLTLDRLTALLYYSAGVTRKKTYPGGGEVLFRAAPSTGALYQTEVYVMAGAVEGLAAGLYHFCPGDFALRRLRDGDGRAALAAAAADDGITRAAATIVLSAIYWRNTWKYQARGYRHLFWDSGTMLANLLAAAAAVGLSPRVDTGFVDGEVNRLLGLDAEREAALELVVLGPEATPAAPAARIDPIEYDPIRHDVLPLSSEEVDYPRLREAYAASTLGSADEVCRWRAATSAPAPSAPGPPTMGHAGATPLPVARGDAGRALGETVQRRASTRQFSHAPLSCEELGTTLWWATRGFHADVPAGLVDLFLIVNAVHGVAAGAYRYRPGAHALETVKLGAFRRESGYLCLEQPLGADAAAVIYFLAPLAELLRVSGNRGYRLANLEAGLIGGRAYLAAYAQGFGASGLTFYDRHVADFFAPASAGLDAVFVTALGRSAGSAESALFLTQRIRPVPS